jgi:DivIVA domain-containing protein
MALLTADDVLNKKFQATKFREGYDQDEVDDFLDEIVNTLRALTAENEDLTSKLAAAERRIAELNRAAEMQAQNPPERRPEPMREPEPERRPEPPREPEPEQRPAAPNPAAFGIGGGAGASQRPNEPESATGMLQLAQKLHDDYVRSGQEEGERIIAESRVQATRIVREAEETSDRTMAQLEQERGLLERKIDELRVFERDYRTRLKSYLENLLTDLETRTSSVQQRQGGDSGLPYNG